MISAETHSDDYAVEITFDATKWFEHASDKEIEELAKIEWGGNYAADAVAEFFEETDTAELFKYLSYHPRMGNGDTVGFECHVKESDALAWIKANRPSLSGLLDEA